MCGFLLRCNSSVGRTVAVASRKNRSEIEYWLSLRGNDEFGCLTRETDSGVSYEFFFSRLEIVGGEAGAQPIPIDDDLVLLFNGEIYNKRSLAKRFKVFEFESDTVLLAEILKTTSLEYLVSYIDGMFAICVVDLSRNEVVLARDAFGQKPLFLFETGHSFIASSNIGAIVASESLGRVIPQEIADQFSAFGGWPFLDNGELTVCPPGTVLSFSLLRSKNRLAGRVPFRLRAEEADFGTLFSDRSTEIVGISLSGGADSQLVASWAARYRQPGLVRCYSIDDQCLVNTEIEYAKRFGKLYGLPVVPVALPSSPGWLHKLVKSMGTPVGDSSYVGSWSIFQAMKADGIRVAYGGDGGDELFGCYKRYHAYKVLLGAIQLPLSLRRVVVRYSLPFVNNLVSVGASLITVQKIKRYLSALLSGSAEELYLSTLKLTAEPSRNAVAWDLIRSFSERIVVGQSIQGLREADFTLNLAPILLNKVDTSSMASLIECRSPMFSDFVASKSQMAGERKPGYAKDKLYQQLFGANFVISQSKKGFVTDIDSLIMSDDVSREFWFESLRIYHRFWGNEDSNYLSAGVNRQSWPKAILGGWVLAHGLS